MFRLSAQRATRSSFRPFSTRSHFLQQQQPQYQAPDQTTALPTEKPNPHREIYKKGGVGRPVARNFLIAMVTFQVLYWSWLKLESIEVKQEKQAELNTLENDVKTLTGFKRKDGEK